jgi:hypothetical protein
VVLWPKEVVCRGAVARIHGIALAN